MTREDVKRDLTQFSACDPRDCAKCADDALERAVDEIVRLRERVEKARETAENVLGFVLVADGGGFRPQAGSYVTPLEFHQATTHAMRALLAALGGNG